MTVAATTAAAATTAKSDATGIGRARLAENFDTFLSLLTTQLKNQDPLSPMDSNQFTQQMVQMTGVEQQLATNDLLKKLVANTTSGVATAVSLIGKEVRAEADVAALKNQKADWTYKLDRVASDVKLEVLDSKGRIVATKAVADAKAGENKFTWDGKTSGGAVLADGIYSLRVTAKDGFGTVVPSKIFADGLVTGVEQADGSTLLTINGTRIPWEKLVNIRQPDPPADKAKTIASPITGSNTNNLDDKTSSPAAA
ncbi:flagellar hook assembly protein FlgD [Phenylobacterium sp.]|jgi:flagellar basal-body rod modification protein FlgD|uniref:flagellar hook assembly protein FlgD n=1 Tax=Phenylobacterium sp. TaxID=1871053 RepID=UPI0037C8AE34